MAKIIQRTITVYTYTTGKLDFTTMKMENIKNHSFPYRLGERAKRSLEKAEGNPIVAETTGSALYGMDIETFLKYAKPITKEDEDTGLSDPDSDGNE